MGKFRAGLKKLDAVVVLPRLEVKTEHAVVFGLKLIHRAGDMHLGMRDVVKFEHLLNIFARV
ncbi:hypothetical protein SDC9_199721 [bioreactor metagenome]|uniref:Uncharacterized protein n=1 Tax=bioreactor metagenome TaxID=1076179 RepID=A0A645ILC9_9ZZZZ